MNELEAVAVGLRSLMSERHEGWVKLADEIVDQSIARWGFPQLLGDLDCLAVNRGGRETGSLQGKPFDERPQRSRAPWATLVGPSLAHQAGESCAAIAAHPTLRGPKPDAALSGDRGEGNALFEVRTNDLKTLQGMHSFAFGQSAQRLGTGVVQ